MKKEIQQILNTTLKNINLDKHLDNIVLINQKQSLEKDDEGNLIIHQCYGMDSLFNKIYEVFKSQKINFNEIEKSTNEKQMMNFIGNYKLLEKMKIRLDININLKIHASNIILSYSKNSKKNKFFDMLIKKKEKEMLNKISKIYDADKTDIDIDNILLNIKNQINNMDKLDKDILIENIFNSLKTFENIFFISDFDLTPYYYDKHIVLIGAVYLKNFEKEFGEYNEKTKIYLKGYCSILNKAIDGFNLIANEWTSIYSD